MATVTRTTVRNPDLSDFSIQLSTDYKEFPQFVKKETHPRFMELLAITNGTRPDVSRGQVWSYSFVNEDGSMNEGHAIIMNVLDDGTVAVATIFLGLGDPQSAGDQWIVPICDMRLTGDGEGYRLQGTYLPSDVTGEIQRGYTAPQTRKGLGGMLKPDPAPAYTPKAATPATASKQGTVTGTTTKSTAVTKSTDTSQVSGSSKLASSGNVKDAPAAKASSSPSHKQIATPTLASNESTEERKSLVDALMEGKIKDQDALDTASTIASIVTAVVKSDKRRDVIKAYRAKNADAWPKGKVEAQRNLMTIIKEDFPGDCQIELKLS